MVPAGAPVWSTAAVKRPIACGAAAIRSGSAPWTVLIRNFTAAGPNCVWVADFTNCRTWAGPCYVAFIGDVFAKRIVSWLARRYSQAHRPGPHSAADPAAGAMAASRTERPTVFTTKICSARASPGNGTHRGLFHVTRMLMYTEDPCGVRRWREILLSILRLITIDAARPNDGWSAARRRERWGTGSGNPGC
jgi:hypothetical protein